MASVHLNFVPPQREGFTKLYIYEAPTADPGDPLVLIETVTEIGAYPSYLSEYTTDDATNVDHWFAIRWEDDKGAQTGMSERVQGSTQTVVGELVDRVLLRSPALNEAVVAQEAEYVVSMVMVTENPYDPNLNPSLRQMEGMTLLTQARTEISTMAASSTGNTFVAGLVSMKNTTAVKDKQALIDYLMKEAGRILGLRVGIIAQMKVVQQYDWRYFVDIDQSRLLATEILRASDEDILLLSEHE